MADQTPKKAVVIILDMANGYGWKPGSFGYDMVARVRHSKLPRNLCTASNEMT